MCAVRARLSTLVSIVSVRRLRACVTFHGVKTPTSTSYGTCKGRTYYTPLTSPLSATVVVPTPPPHQCGQSEVSFGHTHDAYGSCSGTHITLMGRARAHTPRLWVVLGHTHHAYESCSGTHTTLMSRARAHTTPMGRARAHTTLMSRARAHTTLMGRARTHTTLMGRAHQLSATIRASPTGIRYYRTTCHLSLISLVMFLTVDWYCNTQWRL